MVLGVGLVQLLLHQVLGLGLAGGLLGGGCVGGLGGIW